MAIKPKETTQGGEFTKKLFVGTTYLKVVAINPSQDELKTLGFKADKAPVYKNETTGKRTINFLLHFEVDNQKYLTKHTIFTENKVMPGVFLDKFGKIGKDRTQMDTESAREAYVGEFELLQFIQAWVNIGKGEELRLDSIQSIVESGDLTEVKKLLKSVPDNLVQGFLYVSEDGKYQQVFGRKFEKSFSKTSEYIFKELVKQQQHLKGNFGGLNFKSYNPNDFKLREITVETSPKASESKVVETVAAEDDDAPF